MAPFSVCRKTGNDGKKPPDHAGTIRSNPDTIDFVSGKATTKARAACSSLAVRNGPSFRPAAEAALCAPSRALHPLQLSSAARADAVNVTPYGCSARAAANAPRWASYIPA
ncbi:hypothetical protein BG53_09130 [Paenibacillus darwinianus]|uniref:Uncharacterized protein n=1 Tax=Paenibacillus darwinianus TaxID=1380763 RepID=A0A9W5RYI9_9BACL|nr:hypothetical protein CH50_11095 [Paenibacillus darwinianus]EXX85230.1 hypothetical protein BG53_09130 [Paenibacillus darwinianus]